MSVKKLLVLWLVSSNLITEAQTLINIDHRQMSVETTGLIGDFEVDFDVNNIASTQEEEKNFVGIKSGADLSYYSKKHHYFLKSHVSFFELEEEEVQNQSFVHFRANLLYEKRFAPELYAQWQHDELRRLESRVLGGGGLRYVIHKDDDIELDAGSGLMYEYEKWEFEEQERLIEKYLLKSSSYFSVHKSFGKNGLSFHSLYQWGFDPDIDNIRHRINGDVRFHAEISKLVALVVHVSLSYDAMPIVPNKKLLYGVSNALRFSFGHKQREARELEE